MKVNNKTIQIKKIHKTMKINKKNKLPLKLLTQKIVNNNLMMNSNIQIIIAFRMILLQRIIKNY